MTRGLLAVVLAACGASSRPDALADAGAELDAAGAVCEQGQTRVCYAGDPETDGVGACHAGIAICRRGLWAACDHEVLPTAETCDGEDDDCDGEVDDGVLSACGVCGTCGAACFGVGHGCVAWDEGAHDGFTIEDAALFPSGGGIAFTEVAWIQSFWDGFALRVNTSTLEVEASFWTGWQHGMNGDRPSQVLVDFDGNVIVANEADGRTSSITKIAGLPDGCVDRDASGAIETSTGWNDRLDFEGPDDWADECILWHTSLEEDGAVGLALVEVDGVERGWVALVAGRFVELDPERGALTGTEVSTSPFAPNAAAADREGRVWFSGYDVVGRFDAHAPELGAEVVDATFDGVSVYNVIVDEHDVPWVGGDQLWRWDPVGEDFVSVGLPDSGRTWGFGFVAASDGQGTVWAGSRDDTPELFRITNDEQTSFEEVPLDWGGHFSVDVDQQGRVWAVPGSGGENVATSVFDPAFGTIDGALADCGGVACIGGNMARGDFTGQQLRNVRQPIPEIRRVARSDCADPARTVWRTLTVDADLPPGNVVVVDVRAAASVEELGALAWTGLGRVSDGDAFALDALAGGPVLELRVRATQVSASDPALIAVVSVDWACSTLP